MTEIVTVCDAIRANIAHLPHGPAAGYTTGHGPVPWTPADWAAHPGAVRIDQDPAAADPTADVLDVEAGAATIGECARWAEAAAASYAAGKRPGQRHPAIYMSLSNVTPVVNALIAGGIAEGPNLWIAHWGLTAAEAATVVHLANGPYPVIGVQYRNAGLYDVSAFSADWLATVSGDPAVTPPARWHGEYITAGQFSLTQLAVKLGVPAATLLRMTAVHYGRFDPDLAAWVNGVAAGLRPPTSQLPAGIRFWVSQS
jgi:hypothetical protein